ncbi:MAG: TolC family protein [Rhodocyclaceae bacterium]|nr:TolC family protein [Rhodocyclaceae bacterium]
MRCNACMAALALAASVAAWAPPAAAEPPPGANVDELLALARAGNPEFAAARADAAAAGERVYPAGALADPVLRTELMDVTNYGADAGPNVLPGRVGSTKYTLLQPLPFWGKRDLKRAAAQAEAEAAAGAAGVTWADLAARIKTAYAQYFALARLIELNRDVIDLIGRIEAITHTRYANGLVPQQDAIRVQVERSALRSELIGMETDYHHTAARLNALLARPAHAPLAAPQRQRPLPAPAHLDYAALAERVQAKNPQLFAADARIRAAEKNRDLSYRNRYPDFTLGIAPTQTRNRVNDWELMVELNLPLQQESRRSQEREAEHLLDAARARKEAAANQLLEDLSDNLAAIDAAGRVLSLAQTSLLPQADLTFQAALAGYENGKVDFATLLDAQRQIRKAKQDIVKAQAEQQARLADIERLIGEDL